MPNSTKVMRGIAVSCSLAKAAVARAKNFSPQFCSLLQVFSGGMKFLQSP